MFQSSRSAWGRGLGNEMVGVLLALGAAGLQMGCGAPFEKSEVKSLARVSQCNPAVESCATSTGGFKKTTIEGNYQPGDLRPLTASETRATLTEIFGAEVMSLPAIAGALNYTPDPEKDIIATFRPALDIDFARMVRGLSLEIATKVSADTAVQARFATCALTAVATPCFETFLKGLAARILRRPFFPSELLDYKAKAGTDLVKAIKISVMRMLRSPDFMFHVEVGDEVECDPTCPGTVNLALPVFPLNQYEIANRIAFQTTGVIADNELLTKAGAGLLTNLSEVKAQANRLLSTPKAKNKIRGFFTYWLNMTTIDKVDANVATHFAVNRETTHLEAKEELYRFVENILFTSNGNIEDLFSSNLGIPYTENLKKIYGVSSVSDVPVALPDGRKGVLLRPALLMNEQGFPSPIKRGVFVREHIFCQKIEPPPEDFNVNDKVAELGIDPNTMTNRQVFKAFTDHVACRTCHAKFNPVGFVLEDFGALGERRAVDSLYGVDGQPTSSHPVDASVEGLDVATGRTSFANGAEFASDIAKSPMVHECLSRHFLAFVRFRGLTTKENTAIAAAASQIKAKTLLTYFSELIASDSILEGMKK